jgi:hypothetical protein
MVHSCTIIHVYLAKYVKENYMNYHSRFKLYFEKIITYFYIYSLKVAVKYRRNISVSVMSAYIDHILKNQKATHRRMWQDLQTPETKMYNFPYIVGLHPQIIRRFKWKSQQLVSQILWPSYSTDVISGFFVNTLILAYPPIRRNTLIQGHVISHTVPSYQVGLE